jgi:hypothetical protein
MIDRHYGHLVRDGREHAINALMHRGRWWTLVDVRTFERRHPRQREYQLSRRKLEALFAPATSKGPGNGAFRLQRSSLVASGVGDHAAGLPALRATARSRSGQPSLVRRLPYERWVHGEFSGRERL